MRRLVLATVMATLVLAGEARADSVTLNAYTTTGQSDMVAGVARIWSVSGVATNPIGLLIKFRPSADSRARRAPRPTPANGSAVTPGTAPRACASRAIVRSPFRMVLGESPGTYQLCYWFADRAEHRSRPPITQTIIVRRPTGSITATIESGAPRARAESTTVTVTGTTESPKQVFATVRAAGSACAPSYSSDTGSSLIYGHRRSTGSSPSPPRRRSRRPATTSSACGSSGGRRRRVADRRPAAAAVQRRPAASGPVLGAGSSTARPRRRVSSFRARKVGSVCMRYQFSTTPLAGARVTVSFVRPNRRTHTVARTTWGESQSQPITLGPLNARAWRNRRGTWKAVLRVDGRTLHTASFRVRR